MEGLLFIYLIGFTVISINTIIDGGEIFGFEKYPKFRKFIYILTWPFIVIYYSSIYIYKYTKDLLNGLYKEFKTGTWWNEKEDKG